MQLKISEIQPVEENFLTPTPAFIKALIEKPVT
jgi:hypothetical protein